jgi:nucleotide-binding universal stress UspA family protein
MRVLVAIDGSGPSAVACAVVGSLPWPIGSAIGAVSVAVDQQPPLEPLGLVGHGASGHELETALHDARRTMNRRDVLLDLRYGDPATEIVRSAIEFDADLLVLGSHGHGPVGTMLGASMSAAVADRAPCPVLVVRGTSLEPILFATDGSETATRAEPLLRTWPRVTREPIRVLTVRHRPAPAPDGDSRRSNVDVAEAAAGRLAVLGVPAESMVVGGDPAHAIVAAAAELGAGLVVLGTHGRTGVRRLVLGSVARSVLTHAHSSVLIVRTVPRLARLRAPEPAAAGSG